LKKINYRKNFQQNKIFVLEATKPCNTQESFKLRNQIQEMWKSLRLDIAHRTASLEKQSKTELLSMKDQMRVERKRITKEFNDVSNNHADLDKEFNQHKAEAEREKVKEASRRTVESNRFQNNIREAENKVRNIFGSPLYDLILAPFFLMCRLAKQKKGLGIYDVGL